MALDAGEALRGVAVFAGALQVAGSARGGKAKEILLRGAALAAHLGRRARRGRAVEGLKQVQTLAARDA